LRNDWTRRSIRRVENTAGVDGMTVADVDGST
jgi:hypothetical protein